MPKNLYRRVPNTPLSETYHAGETIAGLDTGHQVRVLTLGKQDGTLLLPPDDRKVMEPADRVVLLGHDDRLRRLEGQA